MIILRALPCSLVILWRYLLVFPFLLIAFAVFGLVAAFLVMIFGFASPLLGVLIAVSFGVAFSVVPAMVGTRLGLVAYQLKPRNTFFGLLLPAFGYGLFEGLWVLVLLTASIGVFVFATPLSVDDLLALGRFESTQIFSELMQIDANITMAVFIIGGFATFGMRAALMVPFAGASIGQDPSGREHTPFHGIGSQFLPMLTLVILSYAGTAMVVPFIFYMLIYFGYGDTIEAVSLQLMTIADFDDFLEIAPELAIFSGLCLVLYLWAFSLQCAGGVLVFLRRLSRADAERVLTERELDELLEDHVEKPDMMELMRSRMPSNER